MADQLLSIEDSSLQNIANAIRTKGGTQGTLEFPDDFVDALQAIETESTVSPKITPQQVTLTPSSPSFQIQAGFHDGSGTVQVSAEAGSANPTSQQVTYTPSNGKFFSSFWVGGIGAGTQVVTGTKTFASAAEDFVVNGLGFTPQGILLFSVPDPRHREYVDQGTSAISVPNLTTAYTGTSISSTGGSNYSGWNPTFEFESGKATVHHTAYPRFKYTYFYIVFG